MIQVLILDDDDQMTRVLAVHLRRTGKFAVTETITRDEAFQAVREASRVFDIFLIDQRLGPGPDGIEVMQELRRLSPETEAVIFTGMDDPNGGLRAYQAGAYRYLTKPIDIRELIWILQSLLEWRETRYERDWLRILTDVAEKTQRALPVADVASLIVRGGQQLGFERTRLWAFDPVEQSLTGISQAGSAGLVDFNGFSMPAGRSPYLQRAFASRDPLFFQGRELGPGYLEGHFSRHGFEPQIGEWALLPLWIGEHCLGVLVLDNASQPSQLRPDQRDLLGLFARQAAAALERAQQHEKTLRLGLADVTAQKQNREKELSILRRRLEAALDITRAIGTTLDLDEALRKIMTKLVQLFPNVTPGVVTFNPTEQELEFAPASAEFYKIDNPDYVDLKRLSLDGPGLASYVARRSLSSKQVEFVNDGHVTENPYYLKLLSNTCSELCVTLMSNKRLLGVLVLEHSERNGFDLDVVELVLNIAGQLSLVIERANQSAQLRFSTTVAATTAWAAEIAHTINQEVSYIRNWVYWLAEEPGLSAEGRRYAEEIDQSAARLAGFSKAGPWHAKALELMNLEFFLKGWIRDAIENRGARVRIEFDLNCQTLYVRANPVALRRVVRHLVRNALEAMPFSGVLLVRTRLIGEHQVEVQIEDTGPGISDHLRRRLFQEPVSTKGDERGFGLLFVRFMVEDMGGAVRLMSPRPDKGANVAFTLPVASVESEEIVDDAGNNL